MFEHGYALLIGVDENKVPDLALPGVKNDVTKLKEVLVHPERCGYSEDNVRVLLGTEATRSNILDGLDWLKNKLQADNDDNQTAFVFYSGHAGRDLSGEVFLIPYDFRTPVRTGGIAATDFAQCVEGIRPRRLMVVLDCCHAGGLNVKGIAEGELAKASVTPNTFDHGSLADGDGRAVLSSSRGTQSSWVRSDGKMSVFTYHLIEALTGYAGRRDFPEVTVTEVMEYVAREVPRTTKQQHAAEQDPEFSLAGSAFPIALVLGGKGIAEGAKAPEPLAPLPSPSTRSILEIDVVDGEAINTEIGELHHGHLETESKVGRVEKDGKFIGTKIDKMG